MTRRPKIEETYIKGKGAVAEQINFVVYDSTSVSGEDEVLQHKIMNSETSHITLHPDGKINFRVKRSETFLKNAINNNLLGYTPKISERLRHFIVKVRSGI